MTSADGQQVPTILLLEDEPDLNELYALHIKALGYEVKAAFDGNEALDHLENHTDISLLLTDVMLGAGEDGHDVARRARSIRPDLPVIFMSGYSSKVLSGDKEGDDNVALLAKPFRRQQLADCLRQLLGTGESGLAPA